MELALSRDFHMSRINDMTDNASVVSESSHPTNKTITSTNEFKESIKLMCSLQDEMKTIAASRKEINDRVNVLKDDVKEYMLHHNVKRCEYDTDDIIVSKRVANGSLTRATLRGALDAYDPQGAADIFEFVVNELGTREVVELKRTKRKAPKMEKVTKKNKIN